MDYKEQHIQLIKAVGNSLNEIYALVNVEDGFEEWRASLYLWDGGDWRLLYRDAFDFGVDCVMMPDSSIAIAREDGYLVLVGEQVASIATSHANGFMLQPISDRRMFLAGSFISVLDVHNGVEALIDNTKGEWAGTVKAHGESYFVGQRGQIVAVQKSEAKFIPSPTRQNLMAIQTWLDGQLIVGGWHGAVHRRVNQTWENISLSEDAAITGIEIRDAKMVVCQGGIYSFTEETHTWQQEMDPVGGVGALSYITQVATLCVRHRERRE